MLVPGPEDQRVRITLEQAEADDAADRARQEGWGLLWWLEDPDRRQQMKKPFAYLNSQWEELKAKMQPGDELCEVCSSEKSWDELMGWHYIELCRDGKPIAQVCLAMN